MDRKIVSGEVNAVSKSTKEKVDKVTEFSVTLKGNARFEEMTSNISVRLSSVDSELIDLFYRQGAFHVALTKLQTELGETEE